MLFLHSNHNPAQWTCPVNAIPIVFKREGYRRPSTSGELDTKDDDDLWCGEAACCSVWRKFWILRRQWWAISHSRCMYAGHLTEVQWHCRARMVVGAILHWTDETLLACLIQKQERSLWAKSWCQSADNGPWFNHSGNSSLRVAAYSSEKKRMDYDYEHHEDLNLFRNTNAQTCMGRSETTKGH